MAAGTAKIGCGFCFRVANAATSSSRVLGGAGFFAGLLRLEPRRRGSVAAVERAKAIMLIQVTASWLRLLLQPSGGQRRNLTPWRAGTVAFRLRSQSEPLRARESFAGNTGPSLAPPTSTLRHKRQEVPGLDYDGLRRTLHLCTARR